jgi:hypothetical protein
MNDFETGGVTFKENASKPDVKPPSFPFRFLVTTLLYILLVLFPVHVGFGVDVKQLWAIVLPTIIFGLIFGRAVTK